MVLIWLMFASYCVIGAVVWVFLTDLPDNNTHDNPLPIMAAFFWPLALPILFTVATTREFIRVWRGYFRKRRALQYELDDARRKRDEQNAADALKEGYR